MSYAGRDSQKDIATRLREAEPKIDSADLKAETALAEIAVIAPPEAYDPGDLTIVFDNRLA